MCHTVAFSAHLNLLPLPVKCLPGFYIYTMVLALNSTLLTFLQDILIRTHCGLECSTPTNYKLFLSHAACLNNMTYVILTSWRLLKLSRRFYCLHQSINFTPKFIKLLMSCCLQHATTHSVVGKSFSPSSTARTTNTNQRTTPY